MAHTAHYETANFDITLRDNSYGYFEHKELGDNCAGGLWFTARVLDDYDGVTALPVEVITALRAAGFTITADFE